MGLDMYLEKEYSLWDSNEAEKKEKILAMFPELKRKPQYIKVSIEVIYWRKANAIHSWFVNYVQGEDDCGRYDVTCEELKELLGTVKRVLADKSLAERLLPTQEGFFFGGTEYDEYYFSDLENTQKSLEEVISAPDFGSAEYYYHSSW